MNQYNQAYLNNLIENLVEESLHLDYKASGALVNQDNKKAEISKDVSAMANSDGGIIIYGIKEDKNLAKEIDPIKRKEFSKEWLEQVIQSKIQPRIEGIHIFPISIDDERVVYVVEIPKSNTAHQAADYRYYKRYNFMSIAMYDYEIRDILNRAKNPQIELEFKYSGTKDELQIIAYNRGTVYAKYLNVKIRIPKKIVKSPVHKQINHDTVEILANNAIREMVNPYATVATYWPTRYEPILPQTRFELTKISLHNYPFDYENILEWDIFCDNANPVSGSIRLADLLNS
ncbi:MAG TPA: ATP-binding protein [Bacteroidia bacterium]